MTNDSLAAAHVLGAADCLARLGSGPDGLTEQKARTRLERVGPNALRPPRPVSAWRVLRDQVRSVVVLLLFAAAVVAVAIGEPLEAAAIAVVLVLNTAIGFFTELRAHRTIEALLELDVPRAMVLREGAVREIDARDLVPGDVIEVEAGQSVPADSRLLAASELRTVEAPLTGESLPVAKRADAVLDEATPLGDRVNMVYKATTVAAGSARAVVVGTGMSTEVGRIGWLIERISEKRTPLEQRLDVLGRRLVALTLGVAALVTAIGLARGVPFGRMLETGIALAIAAVPEGLPAVATIALAVGVHRMARRRALVRRLPSVESLGSATVICADKTGTLTAGQMTVTTLWLDGEMEVTGSGYEPAGEFLRAGRPLGPEERKLLDLALRTGALANGADVVRGDGGWVAQGDPTEAALIVAARKAGLERRRLLDEQPEVAELPFSSERKLMATFHRAVDGRLIAHVKGSPARVLELCGASMTGGGPSALDEEGRARLLEANAALAGRGLRVLALACGGVERAEERQLAGLTFLGLVGMADPPAPGVRDTITALREAGIRTLMLTGDQRPTAEFVARELGLLAPGEEVMEARELEPMPAVVLAERLPRVAVFARVSPEDKVRIVEALQRTGEIVAMLGDGVNDAAALKQADIGVAMGMRGTDLAKETAGIVLQDDRFPTIGAAVEEGRVIFDNIRKFVFYLFSCNFAEVLVLLAAGLLALPLPLLPLQILWLNLVTDTFPALALGLEPADPEVMRRPPRDPEGTMLTGRFLGTIAFYGGLITIATLAVFAWGLRVRPEDAAYANTLAFSTLAFGQLFHLGNARSTGPVVSSAQAVANPHALAALALVIGLQLLAVYLPVLAGLLELRPLAARDWLIVLPLSLVAAAVGQTMKVIGARRTTGAPAP